MEATPGHALYYHAARARGSCFWRRRKSGQHPADCITGDTVTGSTFCPRPVSQASRDSSYRGSADSLFVQADLPNLSTGPYERSAAAFRSFIGSLRKRHVHQPGLVATHSRSLLVKAFDFQTQRSFANNYFIMGLASAIFAVVCIADDYALVCIVTTGQKAANLLPKDLARVNTGTIGAWSGIDNGRGGSHDSREGTLLRLINGAVVYLCCCYMPLLHVKTDSCLHFALRMACLAFTSIASQSLSLNQSYTRHRP